MPREAGYVARRNTPQQIGRGRGVGEVLKMAGDGVAWAGEVGIRQARCTSPLPIPTPHSKFVIPNS